MDAAIHNSGVHVACVSYPPRLEHRQDIGESGEAWLHAANA
jgi:hypothetical protein